MPRYDIKCGTCGISIEIEIERATVKEKYRRKCVECGKVRTFSRDWSAGMAAYHDRLSFMNPRAGRGRGGMNRK